MLRVLLVGILMFAAASASLMAQTGSVHGVVTDTTGRPIADVEVLAMDAARSSRTDVSGRFSLSSIPAGAQLLIVRFPGYQMAQRAVRIDPEAPLAADFRLLRTVQSIDTVRVISHDRSPPSGRCTGPTCSPASAVFAGFRGIACGGPRTGR